MNRLTTTTVKVLIVLLSLIVLIFIGLLMPSLFFESEGLLGEPPVISQVLLWVCVEGFLLCALFLLACTWRLVSLAAADRIFDERAFRWVNAALGSIAVATALDVIATVIVLFQQSESPGAMVIVVGVTGALIGSGLALVVLVMRALLKQATGLKRELEEVV
ncbi:DUF2975 domain-containing protein [Leucobacter tenebrionis]|uniref:DUF2975 domain-containing protein n=1 Tax=Leucobacter tenebrionis TaxID=2873270 RepID=UPI001CA68595|nr:DUF2975 domain-containing protein [Leucobacter tenebrionis]QZY52071.1 DUF2975 domain-containing protein [Leucobacter tenebrionis]